VNKFHRVEECGTFEGVKKAPEKEVKNENKYQRKKDSDTSY